MTKNSQDVDWSVFPKAPESTAYCRCGAIWRTNTKLVFSDGAPKHHTQTPCPKCGKSVNNVNRVSFDPEYVKIG